MTRERYNYYRFEAQLSKPQGNARILVLEDDATLRASIRVTLEETGYVCLEAQDQHEALKILFEEGGRPVELIVSELELLDGSGSDLLKVLSSYLRLARIPIVVLSETTPLYVRPGAARVVGRLEKPFDMKKLLELVDASV